MKRVESTMLKTVKNLSLSVCCRLLLPAAAICAWAQPNVVRAEAAETYTWGQVPIGGGGSIPILVIHPKVKDVIYIGADVGGVDRWDPDAQKWLPTLNYYGAPMGCDAIAVDPSDATGNTVWAAMGSTDWSPGVIIKSTNRGATWSACTNLFPNCSNGDQRWNHRLAVDPANRDVVYFGARNGLWRTVDGGSNWVRLASAPGGNQTQLGKGKGPSGDVMVIIDPTSGTLPGPTRTKRVYLSPLGSALCKTEDGGATWDAMPGAPTNISCAALDPIGVLYCTAAGLSKYSGGATGTWSMITPAALDNNYWSSIAVDPFNRNNILAFHNYTPCYSTNGGATWPYVAAQGSNQSVHATPDWYNPSSQSQFGWGGSNLRFDPFRPGTVWESDCFMTWRTTNIYAKTVHWESLTAGHEETVGTCGMVSPSAGPTLFYNSTADVYGFRHTSLTNWPTQIPLRRYGSQLQLCGADFEEADPNFAAFVGEITWDGPGHGGYTTDGGASFHNFANNPDGFRNAGGRIAVSADSRTLVWATGHATGWGVSYSTDTGATWHASAGLPPNQAAYTGWNIFSFMTPLCSDRVNGNTFYIYSFDKCSFYSSTDGGATFALRFSGLPREPNANLVPDFTRAGDLWLSAKASGLWHSTNGGAAWLKLGNIKHSGMFAIGKGPNSTTPALYLIGKVDGDAQEHIFRSDNRGVNWIRIDMERPYPNGWTYMCGDRQTYGTVYVESSTGVYVGQRSAAARP